MTVEIDELDLREQADNCVYDLLVELQGRGGFDGFWDDIDEETQTDIRDSLKEIVFEYLEAGKL